MHRTVSFSIKTFKIWIFKIGAVKSRSVSFLPHPLVTYKVKFNFQHGLADVESTATPMTVWLLKDIDRRFPKR